MTFKYIVVHDWETSGLPNESDIFTGGQGLQYAAILADAKTLATIDVLEMNIRFEGRDGGSNLFPRFEWSGEAENIR